MQMKEYLAETFHYNDITNRKLLSKIKLLPNPNECIRLFSHLINCQYKWMARVIQDANAVNMSWWDPIYKLEELEEKWNESLLLWTQYLDSKTDSEISQEVQFIGFDGGPYAATPKDIALQLNYHSIHHRAQIQTLIRQQGIEPDFVDYIGTKYRKLI